MSPGRQAADFTHANGRHVRDVMTEDVISVAHDASLEDVVATMEQASHQAPAGHRRMAMWSGVVSRSDLLRALIGRVRTCRRSRPTTGRIRSAILDALEAQPWAPMTTLNVTVSDGVVGSLGHDHQRR